MLYEIAKFVCETQLYPPQSKELCRSARELESLSMSEENDNLDQWRIQDFPEGAPTQKGVLTCYLA